MSKQVLKQLTATIQADLKPVYDNWTESRIKYLHTVKERINNEFTRQNYPNVWARFEAIKRASITKRDYEMVRTTNEAAWREKTAKDVDHAMKKIGVAVEKKVKFDETVELVERIHSRTGYDGFIEGSWALDVDGKRKVFSYETIIAGGYNIQCLHIRTLYRFK